MNPKITILATFLVFFLFGSTFAQDGELPGDANCDGAVNVLDIITMAHYYAGNEPDPFCFENADVNVDGLINVIDIILTSFIFIGYDPGDNIVFDIDGNFYQTVIIDGREWMKENLRVTRYNNEDDISTGLSNDEWSSTSSGAYVIYPYDIFDGLDSDAEVVAAYGKLYNWYSVVDPRGLCPEGWSVPSDDDWTELVNYLMNTFNYHNDLFSGNVNGVGNALKSCRQVGSSLGGSCNTSTHPRWESHSTHHGFDQLGFSALPGGYLRTNGNFLGIGYYGIWWSYSETPYNSAWSRGMRRLAGSVLRYYYEKTYGLSVRCIKNPE